MINFIQVINAEGDVRACGWNCDNIIGNLQTDDMRTILNSDRAKKLRRMIAEGDFSNCSADNCPYLSNGNMDDILVDYNEEEVLYPESLLLAYEGNCNYACTCCSSYQHMADTRTHDYAAMYDALEEKIRPILPYVKHIGANGRGEIFASPRIMKLLSEWEPLAPKEEVSVSIETNGSLFNEKNWKKIQNLGQYHLSVAITVMSFQEEVYQYLSGTKLPINTLLDSLRFVKTLREQNIINRLTIATVLQELNFREMPEFTRRCIEEFGADKVRIRPVFPGGDLPREVQWFMDVRNPEHPYYQLYLRTMEHPIFKDPHILLWSNDLPSGQGKYLRGEEKKILQYITKIVDDEALLKRIEKFAQGKNIAIFGLGTIGKSLINAIENNVSISMIYDKKEEINFYHGIPVKKVIEAKIFSGIVIITPYGRFDEMREELKNSGFAGDMFSLDELF